MDEKAKEVYLSRWNPSKDSLTVYNEKFKVLIAEANLQGSDDKLQIGWYLDGLPSPLARQVRESISTAKSIAETGGNQYNPQLQNIMSLAVTHQTNFHLHQRGAEG